MKTLNTKLVLSALGIALMATPAFAQQTRAHHHHIVARQSGLNAFAMVPRAQGDGLAPAATGGGSIGYNENLRTDTW
jgi:hypothetical protein